MCRSLTMILALKLLLTPFFIASVSLAGRRWGPRVSGLLIGLPLTSGPVSLILALQYGPDFAERAAVGTICGQAAVCFFCLAYGLASRKTNWLASSCIAILAFLAGIYVWNRISPSLWPAFVALVVAIVVVHRLLPRPAESRPVSAAPAWDLPARMAVATTFVLLLTTFANALGPQLSGLISPWPVFGNVLAAFTHHQQGPSGAASLLRGIVLGALAFGSFFLVVGALLPSLGIGWTYALATAVALGINAVLFYLG